jgi:hypothetical protein
MSKVEYYVITSHSVDHVMTVVDGVVVIVPPAEEPIPPQQGEQPE